MEAYGEVIEGVPNWMLLPEIRKSKPSQEVWTSNRNEDRKKSRSEIFFFCVHPKTSFLNLGIFSLLGELMQIKQFFSCFWKYLP